MTAFRVIIPARYQSVRLPGKMLLDIGGLPLVLRTYQQAIKSGADSVIIATDDERIYQAAEELGAKVCLTSPEHNNGTERLAEVVTQCEYADDDIIVNVQGDEPLIPAQLIQQVANNLAQFTSASAATLCVRINEIEEIFNPNIVKVVFDQNGYALYFSRAAIAWERDNFTQDNKQQTGAHYRHIGIYAYRASLLKQFASWEECELERLERLEQLRVLHHGEKIHVAEAIESPPIGIDTAEDLERVRKLFQ